MDKMTIKGPFFRSILKKIIEKKLAKKGIVFLDLSINDLDISMNDDGTSFSISTSGMISRTSTELLKSMIFNKVDF